MKISGRRIYEKNRFLFEGTKHEVVKRRNSRKRGMNVSLVYNNKKFIGKCSKFAIEKVKCTSPFVMLENFEPKQPQLNENQQVVLEWLKGNLVLGYGASLIRTIYLLQRENTIEIPENRYIRKAYRSLSTSEEATVVQLFIDWALEQEEE